MTKIDKVTKAVIKLASILFINHSTTKNYHPSCFITSILSIEMSDPMHEIFGESAYYKACPH